MERAFDSGSMSVLGCFASGYSSPPGRHFLTSVMRWRLTAPMVGLKAIREQIKERRHTSA